MARVVFESDVQGTREWQQEITQKVQVPFEESIRELLAEARVGCRSVRNYDLAEGISQDLPHQNFIEAHSGLSQ